jgi:hypothetical protein
MEVKKSAAKSVNSNRRVINHETEVVAVLGLWLETVSKAAASIEHKPRKDSSNQRPQIGVTDEVVSCVSKLLHFSTHQQTGKKMCPDIDRLVVNLEYTQEIVVPWLVGLTETGMDVWLTEY